MLLILLAILPILVLLYYKTVKPSLYWREKDVPHAPARPLVGSLGDFVRKRKHIADVIQDIYRTYPNERCIGYMQFTQPFLMLRDLELIKQVCVKDFDHFHDHLAFDNIKHDALLSKSLLSLGGDKWKQMRATVSPAFTSSKMKSMYRLIDECARTFVNHFHGNRQRTVDVKEVFCRFTTNVIASTAFGIKIDSLEEPTNQFYTMGNKFTQFGFWQTVKMFVMQLAPSVANLFKLQLFDEEVSTFFRSIVIDNIRMREEDGIIRPDLIHLLMEARKGNLKCESSNRENGEGFAMVEESPIGRNGTRIALTDDHIVAQALTFFFAGFETVSTVSCFMAHELAVNPDVQKRLQLEIDSVNEECKGHPTYEALLSMKYLDQVVCETLRLWPSAFQTDRLCVKDYVIEPKHPKEKVVFVAKGNCVLVPIMAIHRDCKYFPEPERFDPERFSEEKRSKIVPGSYMPFGVGPRNCIGSRFALLEIKVLFFHLLSKFVLVPVEETEIPLKLSPKKISMMPTNGFKLRLQPRTSPSY